MEGLRVSIINKEGRVILDSYNANLDSLGNHLQRTEIQQALHDGNGYDIKRVSQSTHETYFYSATRLGNVIVRAAVPYSAELTRSLQADNTYIYFAIALTLLLGIVLYLSTRRISRHIGYLREFAVKAEEGKELAHELKTPAASIHGYLESILDNPDMPADKRQHFLERCYAQSERMNKLLLDMAQLTKLEAPLPSLSSRKDSAVLIDVVEIINNVLADTSLELEKKGIRVVRELPHRIIIRSPFEESEAWGGKSLSPSRESEGASSIYSIFRNLIDNTLAYATGATQIRISYRDDEFTFADNGVGVEPQHLPHLFERFYRVDKGRSRKLGGTGLGLAIVKNAVAVHGGTTTALTTPGGGLTIRFTLAKH